MPTQDRTRTKGKPRMLPPATVEDQLSREMTSLLTQCNALSALSHAGVWPKAQRRPMAILAINMSRHLLRISTLLSTKD